MSGSVPFTFCDNLPAFHQAIGVLSRSQFLILDCEGEKLGRQDGRLSLICIGDPLAEHIYVFDCLSPALSPAKMWPLWNLLERPDLLKVVWDGRMDYLEIQSTYGVHLQGVLDLQVAEVASRFWKENDRDRLKRLGYFRLPYGSPYSHALEHTGLHALTGLQKCFTDSGFGAELGKDPEVQQMHRDNKTSFWLQRPLSDRLLQYAAKDIKLISMLCNHFLYQGLVPQNPHHFSTLMAQCARYVTAHCEQGKSAEDDTFKPTSIMPLDVLTEPIGPQFKCTGCLRSLSIGCFQQTAIGYRPWRSVRCALCHALSLKLGRDIETRWVHT